MRGIAEPSTAKCELLKVFLPSELKQELREAAARGATSMNEVVVDAIRAFLRAKGSA